MTLFRCEADPRTRPFRRRREQWKKLFVNVLQGAVVAQQVSVDLGQALQDQAVRRQLIPESDKCADHINTHRNCAVAIQNTRSHECAVLRENAGQIFAVLTPTAA